MQGNIGYGKNYHTVNTEPISWEAISELEHFITTLPNGKFLAGVSLPGTNDATPTYEFNSEEEAKFWVQKVFDDFRVKSSNLKH